MSPEETFEEIKKLRDDVSELKANLVKLEATWLKDLNHLTFRMDTISNVRIWIITICAGVAGIAGAVKLIEKFILMV